MIPTHAALPLADVERLVTRLRVMPWTMHPRRDGSMCAYLAIDVCNKCGWCGE